MKELQPFGDPVDGVTFVEASAGTGKTYAIEMLYLRLLVEAGMSPEEIVVVTYTNAAAAELRQRIRARLREANDLLEGDVPATVPWQEFVASRRSDPAVRQRILKGLFEFDRAAIWTIHGFCQRVLVDHAFDSGTGFDLEMITEQTPLVDEVVRDFVAGELRSTPRPLLAAVWGRDGLGEMTRFAARVASQPDLVVEPEASDWRSPLDRWLAAYTSATLLWETESETIAALRGGDAIKGQSRMKPPRVVAAVASALDTSALFVDGRRKELAYLTTAGIEERTAPGKAPPRHRFFDCCQELYDLEPLLEESFRPEIFQKLAVWARREVPGRKAAAQQFYFDDLLLTLRAVLRGPGGERLAEKLRGRFAAALIDEFQDTDPIQYEIFRRIFRDHRPMMLIGDPKQSIYAFRGADIHTYVAAGAEATRKATLSVNRRSTRGLVAAVNALFGVADSFAMPGVDFRPARPLEEAPVPPLAGMAPLTILRCPGDSSGRAEERAMCAAIASRIVRLLLSGGKIGEKPLSAGHLAVLCRTNIQAAYVQEELRKREVPSVLQGDRSVFDTSEALEMLRVLGALVEPRDPSAIRAALCTGLCGLDGDAMVAVETDESKWQEWTERFRCWRQRWQDEGFMSAFRALQVECGSIERLLSRPGGERSLTNFLHLGELLQRASRKQRGGPQALLDWLVLMTSDVAARGEMAAEDVQVRLESEEDAVVLTTIHKSKGLEYPVVFVPFLWKEVTLRQDDRKFPRYHDAGTRRIYVGESELEAKQALAQTEQLAEEMRLTYVALTRAQNACFVAIQEHKKLSDSPIGRIAADAQALSEAAGPGAIAVEDLERDDARLPRRDEGRRLAVPGAPPSIPGGWRVSSFSALTRDATVLTVEEEEGVDRDAVEEPPPVAVSVEPATVSVDAAVKASGESVVLAGLEAGTRVGLMLHSILEDLDFAVQDPAEVRALVERKVRAFRGRLEGVESICLALANVVGAPLSGVGGELTLSRIEKRRRINELEFILPVLAEGGRRLTPTRLAAVLERFGAPAADPGYAARVRSLGFNAFAGYLRGFVDMVFQYEDRWYVVDYKSNFLGSRWGDYAPDRLSGPMGRHDYFLQYLLYVVAVDRYLSRRLTSYSYERDFGGVFYLFLRGMTPALPGNGVFWDRPAPELIDALSKLFEGEASDG